MLASGRRRRYHWLMSRSRRLFTSLLLALPILAGCDNSLEAQCRRGDGRVCGVLGDRERDPDAGGDVGHACDLYRRACKIGNYYGCSNLGALLAQKKCEGAPGEAVSVLTRACDHDDPGGCNNLGLLHRDGELVEKDHARAAAALRKACAQMAASCDNLGSMLIEDKDEAGAAAAFKTGCDSKEDGFAKHTVCFKLALAHENGWGVPRDLARAAQIHAAACDKGVGHACERLGHIEREKADPAAQQRAFTHFQRACSGGRASSCNNLGLMYAMGMGVARDPSRAGQLFQKACESGDLEACANLGSRLLSGDGMTKDEARGRELIQKACAGGVKAACSPPP